MNLQEELKALKERISELEELAKEEQEFPQDGDEYWFIDSTGDVVNSNWESLSFEIDRLEFGHIFKTKEQAEFAVEKLKVEAELRKFSIPFKEDENNCFIQINSSYNNIVIDTDEGYQTQGTIYYETRKEALLAIESVGEERIKKYIFGVEGLIND